MMRRCGDYTIVITVIIGTFLCHHVTCNYDATAKTPTNITTLTDDDGDDVVVPILPLSGEPLS